MMPDEKEFIVTADARQSGQRLDVVVSLHFSECSRSYAAALIQTGKITVEGKKKKPGYRVKDGETIGGIIPMFEPPLLKPEPIPLDILFEDEHIIVVNKPAGLVIHPAPGNYTGTLVNGLLHHCPALGGGNGTMRPGIVHRLDKNTSGTLIVAKTRSALEALSRQFKHREIQKIYLALVFGDVKSDAGTIKLPIGRHPVHRKKMSTVSPRAREAETHWRVKERFNAATLLEMDIKTGRTHQIRVHCASMHHPIVGDAVYAPRRLGSKKKRKDRFTALLQSAERQMLHASSIRFFHPAEKRTMSFESLIPQDMQTLIDGLSLDSAC